MSESEDDTHVETVEEIQMQTKKKTKKAVMKKKKVIEESVTVESEASTSECESCDDDEEDGFKDKEDDTAFPCKQGDNGQNESFYNQVDNRREKKHDKKMKQRVERKYGKMDKCGLIDDEAECSDEEEGGDEDDNEERTPEDDAFISETIIYEKDRTSKKKGDNTKKSKMNNIRKKKAISTSMTHRLYRHPDADEKAQQTLLSNQNLAIAVDAKAINEMRKGLSTTLPSSPPHVVRKASIHDKQLFDASDEEGSDFEAKEAKQTPKKAVKKAKQGKGKEPVPDPSLSSVYAFVKNTNMNSVKINAIEAARTPVPSEKTNKKVPSSAPALTASSPPFSSSSSSSSLAPATVGNAKSKKRKAVEDQPKVEAKTFESMIKAINESQPNVAIPPKDTETPPGSMKKNKKTSTSLLALPPPASPPRATKKKSGSSPTTSKKKSIQTKLTPTASTGALKVGEQFVSGNKTFTVTFRGKDALLGDNKAYDLDTATTAMFTTARSYILGNTGEYVTEDHSDAVPHTTLFLVKSFFTPHLLTLQEFTKIEYRKYTTDAMRKKKRRHAVQMDNMETTDDTMKLILHPDMYIKLLEKQNDTEKVKSFDGVYKRDCVGLMKNFTDEFMTRPPATVHGLLALHSKAWADCCAVPIQERGAKTIDIFGRRFVEAMICFLILSDPKGGLRKLLPPLPEATENRELDAMEEDEVGAVHEDELVGEEKEEADKADEGQTKEEKTTADEDECEQDE